MSRFKGTKTEQNLKDAFAGESQAHNKYSYYAAVAKKEGYEKIAAIFLETAENEKVHAKLHFKNLDGIGSTIENLKAAAAGETYEFTEMYPQMAKDAREEGFADIASFFESVGKIEKHHQQRYQMLLEEVEAGTCFSSSEKVSWKCMKCGHIHEGTEAAKICPVCKHPQAYFEKI